MTATLDGLAARKRKNRPEPAAEQKLAEELVARARDQGVSLTGPDGLLKQLTKTVLETALNQEGTAATCTAPPPPPARSRIPASGPRPPQAGGPIPSCCPQDRPASLPAEANPAAPAAGH